MRDQILRAVALGLSVGDPIVGLLMTMVILRITWQSFRTVQLTPAPNWMSATRLTPAATDAITPASLTVGSNARMAQPGSTTVDLTTCAGGRIVARCLPSNAACQHEDRGMEPFAAFPLPRFGARADVPTGGHA